MGKQSGLLGLRGERQRVRLERRWRGARYHVTLDPKLHNTPETVLRGIVAQLTKGWYVTKLPSHSTRLR